MIPQRMKSIKVQAKKESRARIKLVMASPRSDFCFTGFSVFGWTSDFSGTSLIMVASCIN